MYHWCKLSYTGAFCYTNGEKMIYDLQGTVDDTGYTLTDPVLLSINGDMYGATDVGVVTS